MGTEGAGVRVIAGRYRLESRLGRGGMGVVWRATDELLGRQVAVKEIPLDLDETLSAEETGRQRDRTLREARAVAQLRHPHVIVVHDVVEQDERPYLVMELIDGGSLADRISRRGPVDAPEAARIGIALLSALATAHAAGVLHRDIKPANVLLGAEGDRVVLTDFGIAQVAGATTLTETGAFVGSPEYTAPERMSGARTGPESDLWSLGALLCTILSGESPFRRDSLGGILHAVVFDEIRPPAQAAPLLPVVRGLLERDPDRRLDAAQAERMLRAYLDTGRTPHLPTGRPPHVPTDRTRRLLTGRTPRFPHGRTPRLPHGSDPQLPPGGSPRLPPGSSPESPPGSDPQLPPGSNPQPPPGSDPQPPPGSRSSGPDDPMSSRTDEPTSSRPHGATSSPAPGATPSSPTVETRRSTRGVLTAALLVAAMAGAGVSAAALLMHGDDDGGGSGTATSSGPGVSVSATTAPGKPTSRTSAPSAPVSGTPTAGTPTPSASRASSPAPTRGHASAPSGYRVADDPAGFSLAVPEGFTRTPQGERVFYLSPGQTFRLGIKVAAPQQGGPLGVMRRAAAKGPDTNPGYHDGRVTATTHHELPAALWEFTWNGFSSAEGPRHTYDLCWEEDGRLYDVWVSAPVGKVREAKEYFDVAVDTFVTAL